jgi:imidazoleglycerol-phosphate dehydratase
MTARTATLNRTTNETNIQVKLNLDAVHETQHFNINTGIGFLDHVCHFITITICHNHQ